MAVKEEIIKQINSSPEPLKSYIHDLETTLGNVAHLIQDNFMLREENEQLLALLDEVKTWAA